MSDAPEVTARTVYAADLDCGGNRTVRLALESGPDGPEALRLVPGWDSGAAFRPDGEGGLALPAKAIGPLRAALCALVLEASKIHPAGET